MSTVFTLLTDHIFLISASRSLEQLSVFKCDGQKNVTVEVLVIEDEPSMGRSAQTHQLLSGRLSVYGWMQGCSKRLRLMNAWSILRVGH